MHRDQGLLLPSPFNGFIFGAVWMTILPYEPVTSLASPPITDLPDKQSCRPAGIGGHSLLPVWIGRLLTLDRVWWLIVPLLLMSILNRQAVAPNDFWWHVRTGQIMLAEWQIPLFDRYTFTQAGAVWVNQAWLMQIVLYGLYQSGGLPLVIFSSALMISAGYSLVLLVVSQYAGIRIGVVTTVVGVTLGHANWMVRPQIISFFCFGLLVYLIEAHRRDRRRRLWWAVPLFAFWVNAHGGFVFGLALLAFYTVGRLGEFFRAGPQPSLPRFQSGGHHLAGRDDERTIVQLLVIALLACAALALNPQGSGGIVQYVLGFVQSQATTQYNLEFQPLNIRQLDGFFFFVANMLLVTGLVAAGRSGFRLSIDQILQLLVFGALALLARRNVPWYGFVLTPILAAVLSTWWHRSPALSRGKPILNGLLIGGMSLWLLTTLPWWRPHVFSNAKAWVTPTTPVAATHFLCTEAPDGARVYQDIAFSSYQIWACPRLPVYMDTRIELYPLDQWLAYLAIGQARFDWEQLLATERITHLMLNPAVHAQLLRAAEAAENWRMVYRDAHAVIFEKTTASRN